MALLDRWAQDEYGASGYDELNNERQAALRGRLRPHIRANTYDPETGTITLGAARAAAIETVAAHYQSLSGKDPATATLREAYAMKDGTVPDPEHRRMLSAFFWWTAWAAATERPGDTIFAIGALALAIFVAGLWLFPRREDEARERDAKRGEDVRAASPGLDR